MENRQNEKSGLEKHWDRVFENEKRDFKETIHPHEMEYLDIDNADDNADFYACVNDHDYETDFYGE